MFSPLASVVSFAAAQKPSEETQRVIRPPTVHIFRNPQRTTPTPLPTTPYTVRAPLQRGRPTTKAPLQLFTSPLTMTWFWSTPETMRGRAVSRATGDQSRPQAETSRELNEGQTTSLLISTSAYTVGKLQGYMHTCVENYVVGDTIASIYE